MSAPVRLATVHLRGLLRSGADVAASLAALDADVLCVQGTPRWVRWRSRCAALARRAGLVYVTGGGTASGTMLLCSPRAFVAHREEFPLPGIAQPAGRSLAIAVFSFTGGPRLVVGSIRLGRATVERLRHLDLVASRLVSLGQKFSAPYALAGDLHERAGGPTWRRLATVLPGTALGRAGTAGIFASTALEPAADTGTNGTRQAVVAELELTNRPA